MGRPISSPPEKPIESEMLLFLYYKLCLGGGGGGGGGNKWAGPFLPHPQNQVKAKYSKFCVISYI